MAKTSLQEHKKLLSMKQEELKQKEEFEEGE